MHAIRGFLVASLVVSSSALGCGSSSSAGATKKPPPVFAQPTRLLAGDIGLEGVTAGNLVYLDRGAHEVRAIPFGGGDPQTIATDVSDTPGATYSAPSGDLHVWAEHGVVVVASGSSGSAETLTVWTAATGSKVVSKRALSAGLLIAADGQSVVFLEDADVPTDSTLFEKLRLVRVGSATAIDLPLTGPSGDLSRTGSLIAMTLAGDRFVVAHDEGGRATIDAFDGNGARTALAKGVHCTAVGESGVFVVDDSGQARLIPFSGGAGVVVDSHVLWLEPAAGSGFFPSARAALFFDGGKSIVYERGDDGGRTSLSRSSIAAPAPTEVVAAGLGGPLLQLAPDGVSFAFASKAGKGPVQVASLADKSPPVTVAAAYNGGDLSDDLFTADSAYAALSSFDTAYAIDAHALHGTRTVTLPDGLGMRATHDSQIVFSTLTAALNPSIEWADLSADDPPHVIATGASSRFFLDEARARVAYVVHGDGVYVLKLP